MHQFSDARQIGVLLRIGSDLDIVGDVSVVASNPAEVLAWANVLDNPAIRSWRSTSTGDRYIHVTATSTRSPVHGRITAILTGNQNRTFWDALHPDHDLEPGEHRELSRAALSQAWADMPLSAPPTDDNPTPTA